MVKEIINTNEQEQFALEFESPTLENLSSISKIFHQWLDEEETQKYVDRIKAELEGKSEYGMNFFVLKNNGVIIGVGGLADPLPSIMQQAQTANPGELKILYLDNEARGRGFGTKFLQELERKAAEQGRSELLVRSAEQFRETAFEFYKHAGYEDLGQIINDAGKPMELFRKTLKPTYEN